MIRSGCSRGAVGHPDRPRRSPRLVITAVVTILALGFNWPIMAVGVNSIPPFWFGVIRLSGSGVILAAVLLATSGLQLPARRDLPIVLSVAILRLSIGQGLIFVALTLISAGRASMLVYTSALWVAPISVFFLRERLGVRSVFAVGVGTLGVVVLMEPWNTGGEHPILGSLLLVCAALASAVGSVHMRGHSWQGDQLQLIAWQLILGGALLFPFAVMLHGAPRIDWTPTIVAIALYQVLVASLLGFWGTVTLARGLPAVTNGMLSLATPIVGVLSSAIVLGERLNGPALTGMTCIVVGVLLRLTDSQGQTVR